eukprot:14665266-Alexandrium_andersonii.AAC.1
MGIVESRTKREIPLAVTPIYSFLDVELADDTVAQAFLNHLEKVAAAFGLTPNKQKTTELALNSDVRIKFSDGSLVPREAHTKYLG